jgi:TolB-like protein
MFSTSSAPLIQRLTSDQEALVRRHLEELVQSRALSGSKRSQDFLRLIVEHTLAGEIDRLRERMIGAEMFNRPIDYDTANDSVVRVKATEMRKKLIQAYAELGVSPPVRIEVPPGSYVPRFVFQAPDSAASTAVNEAPFHESSLIKHKEPTSQTRALTQLPNEVEASAQTPRTFRWNVTVVASVCVAGLLIYGGLRVWRHPANAEKGMRSLVVLPFENLSGDPKQEYLADGMTEELIADLGQMSELHVISRTSAMSFKASHKELPEIARELLVDGVVEGSILREGTQTRITVRLIDARTDRPVWGQNFTRSSTDTLASEGELAQSIANELSLTVSPQTQTHLARAPSVSMEAEDLYLQGMLDFHSGNCENAMAYFQKAIQADSRFANAYGALASCYGLLGEGGWMAYGEAFSNEKSNALRAIEFDDSLSEGHAALAGALMNADWDLNGAEKQFKQALALNPNSASVHDHYGGYLVLMGNHDSAIEEAQIAVKLDPLSGRALSDLAYIYYFSRQYDQTLALLKMAEAKDPNLHPDIFAYGDVYVEKGMYRESINEFLRLGENPHALGHLGNAYARAGQPAAALKIIAELQQRVQKDQLGAYEIALVYTGLGQKDQAFAWLQKAFENHDRGLIFLKVDPPMDPLRSDPRFDQLMVRVGLPGARAE